MDCLAAMVWLIDLVMEILQLEAILSMEDFPIEMRKYPSVFSKLISFERVSEDELNALLQSI